MTLCESVELVCSTLSKITHSLITTVSKTGVKRYYYPTEDTNTARVYSLTQALQQVPENSEVVLEGGTYVLDRPIKSIAAHRLFKFRFTNSAALWYTDEKFADDSDFAYEGDFRDPLNHGIYPDTGIDMQPRIQAALFSMKLWGEAVIDCPDYPPGFITSRMGELRINYGTYNISKPVYYTGFQAIVGSPGRYTIIEMMSGFAPTGSPERFMFRMLPAISEVHSFGASNWSYLCRIENIYFSNKHINNTMGSAILHGGAQGSVVDNIWIYGMGCRGLAMIAFSMYFKIGRIFGDGNWGVTPGNPGFNFQTGPLVHIANCAGFTVDSMTLQYLNYDPAARKTYHIDINGVMTYDKVLSGCIIHNCTNFHINAMNGETLASLIGIYNCYGFTLGPCSVGEANGAGIGEVMVRIAECEGWTIAGMNAINYQKFYEVTQGGPAGITLDSPCTRGPNVKDRCYGATSLLNSPNGFYGQQLYLYRQGNLTPDAGLWTQSLGGNLDSTVYQFSSSGSNGSSPYIHTLIRTLGAADPNFVLPPGWTMSLDHTGQGGVMIGRCLNVGWVDTVSAQIQIASTKVIGKQGLAVPNAAVSVAAPTKAEFDALVTTVNALLGRLRASTGHGLFAG